MEPPIILLKKANSCPAKLRTVLRKKRTPFPNEQLNEEDLDRIFNTLNKNEYLHGSLKHYARGRNRCARCSRNHRFARTPRRARFTRSPRRARFTRRCRRVGRPKCTRMNRRR